MKKRTKLESRVNQLEIRGFKFVDGKWRWKGMQFSSSDLEYMSDKKWFEVLKNFDKYKGWFNGDVRIKV